MQTMWFALSPGNFLMNSRYNIRLLMLQCCNAVMPTCASKGSCARMHGLCRPSTACTHVQQKLTIVHVLPKHTLLIGKLKLGVGKVGMTHISTDSVNSLAKLLLPLLLSFTDSYIASAGLLPFSYLHL